MKYTVDTKEYVYPNGSFMLGPTVLVDNVSFVLIFPWFPALTP